MLSISFTNAKKIKLKLEAQNIREILKLQHLQYNSFQPIAFQLSNGNIYYYNENVINTFINDETMQLVELDEFCLCHGIYKNTTHLITDDYQDVDKESLWMKKNNILQLIDDDRYIESTIIDKCFEKIV